MGRVRTVRGSGRGGRAGLRALAELLRAPAALTVPGDVLAGSSAAGLRVGVRPAGLAAASVALYWAGMALNDWADREIDAVERPERPLPSGRIRPATALAVACGCTGAGLGLAALSGGRRALAVAVPLAASVWAYDLVLKNTPAGPLAMSAARGLDLLLGAAPAGWPGLRAAALPALTLASHTAAVTWLSRREVTGTVAALPAAALAATAAVAVAVMVPVADGRTAVRPRGPFTADGIRALATAALAAEYLRGAGAAQLHAVRDPRAARVRTAVGAGIQAMVPLQGALTARSGAPAAGILLTALLPAVRRLSRKVSPT